MPTIVLKSKVRTASEHCSLSLNIRHCLLLGKSSEPLLDMKPTIPEAVDVLLFSSLLITVSGSLDGARIPPSELKTSHIANHLVDFLQTNAGELGINAVSELYISEDTHLLSLTLTASRHCRASTDTLPVHLELIALDLDYVWQTNSNAIASGRLDAAVNPFSRHLSLPYLTATDNAVGRFVTFHLVRRYPLIFGPWCKQLDVECSFFPSILISIQNIMKRSRSSVFQATCQKVFKLCKREIMSASISAIEALSKYLNLETETYSASAIYAYNEEEAFFLCLERIYRLGMKRPNFRRLSLFTTITTGSSEDLLSDALVTFETFGVNCSSNRSFETSGLLSHVSLFEGTYTDGSSDLELNTEDGHRVTPPDSYQNDDAPEESLDQICHLIDTPFVAKWAELSAQDSCDDIYDLSEDEAGLYGTFEQCPSNKNDYSKDDLGVDSDIDYFPEEPDGGWQLRGWSPDSLSHDQNSLGNVSFPCASSLAPPLKMPVSLNSAAFEDVLDPLHVGYEFYLESDRLSKHNPSVLANRYIIPYERPTLRSLAQTEDVIHGDHYLELESDMMLDSKPVITDGDHGVMTLDFVPKSFQPFNSRSGTLGLFSGQHSGQSMCGYENGPAVGGDNSGVRTDDYRFLAIEYDSDISA